ncbi:MAG: hypothetical protein H7255_14550 [Ramlibacter sp.]|nr:hypothetical protein [Ramlibacter sp.]
MTQITDYASLKLKVAAWLRRDSDTGLMAVVPDLIQFAENRIYRDLRIRAMESTFTDTISSGVIALPANYVALKHAHIDGAPTSALERKDAEWIAHAYPNRSGGGKPKFIARDTGNFVFGPYPDSAYTVSGTYYRRLPALAGDAATNWFIQEAPELMLFAALAEAEPFLVNDPRTALWEQKYSQIVSQIQRKDDEEEFSGSPLSLTSR